MVVRSVLGVVVQFDSGTGIDGLVEAVDTEGGKQSGERERGPDSEFICVVFVYAAGVHEFITTPDIDFEQLNTSEKIAVLVPYFGHDPEIVR